MTSAPRTPRPRSGPARWASSVAAAACALGLAGALGPAAGAHGATATPEPAGAAAPHAAHAAAAADPAGEPRPLLVGGEAIHAGGARCAAGFNATSGAADFVLTAGHCGGVGTAWSVDPGGTTPLGVTVAAVFPGADHALVEYANDALPRPGSVRCGDEEIEIVGARDPVVGEELWVAGPGFCHAGTVSALGVSVNYPAGVVNGLFRFDACTEPGGSGGPVFSRDGYAVGIVSGGSGDCASGGTTFAQPVPDVLEAHGVTLR